MARIHVEVKGITPYVFNKQVEGPIPKTVEQDVQRAIDLVYCSGKKVNSFKPKDVEGSPLETTCKINDGKLFMPGNQYRGTMRGAMQLLKMKLEGANKRAIDTLNASVFIEPSWIEFNPVLKMKDVRLMRKWIITDPIRGKGIYKYFSCIPEGWQAQFDIEHMGLFDISFLQAALANGGFYCGVGGRRIHKNGRFEVVKFEVVG
jgi:hypothetical protein